MCHRVIYFQCLCFYFALLLYAVSMHLTPCDLMSFFFIFLFLVFGAAIYANKDVYILRNSCGRVWAVGRLGCLSGLCRGGGGRQAGTPVLSCLMCPCKLDDCSERVQTSDFSVGDSLELSGIQFTPSKRTRHRQDSCVVSDVAV